MGFKQRYPLLERWSQGEEDESSNKEEEGLYIFKNQEGTLNIECSMNYRGTKGKESGNGKDGWELGMMKRDIINGFQNSFCNLRKANDREKRQIIKSFIRS